MNKHDKVRARQEAIRELISSYPIENQAALVRLLEEKYDIATNQSIVSRDLQELDVVKHKYKDTIIYELKGVDPHKEILRLGVQDVVYNESLIVVKTLAGLADFVGDYLDTRHDAKILATLAGENVVFIIPCTVKKIEEVYTLVCDFLYFKQKEQGS